MTLPFTFIVNTLTAARRGVTVCVVKVNVIFSLALGLLTWPAGLLGRPAGLLGRLLGLLEGKRLVPVPVKRDEDARGRRARFRR